jgi:PAS domain S-box-containing protein
VTPQKVDRPTPADDSAINPILERAKAEWEAAFDAISEGIAIVDLDGTVRRVNRALASLLGRDVRNMVNVPCCDLFAHHRAHPDSCPVRNYPAGKMGTFEVFFPDYRYYEDATHAIMQSGTLHGLVIVVKDVTREQMAKQEKRHLFLQMEEAARRRKLAEDSLGEMRTELTCAQKTASMGRLANVVFGEVSRTLHMVRDGLQLVAEGTAKEDSVDDMIAATTRCATVLDKLGQVRVTDGSNVSPIPLHELLREVASELADEQARVNTRIDLTIHELPPTEGNADQLRAVFSSLMLNALQATPPEADAIQVLLRRDGALARVEVHDHGAGIDSAHLPHIFSPFFTTDPKSQRIGLGLTICQSIIQGHRGHVDIESEPGRGTTATVLLPILESD